MQYISQMNAFWNLAKLNPLPSKAGYLYFAILDCANTAGWKREFNAPNSTLQAMAGLDKNALTRYRNVLIQQGLIKYKAGDRGASGRYEVVRLYEKELDLIPETRKQIDTKDDAKTQPKLMPKPNQNRGHTKEKEKDIDEELFSPLPPPLRPVVEKWVEYKREKKQAYKPVGLATLVKQLCAAAEEYGAEAVVEVIELSMASNYQGIVLDRLKERRTSRGNGETAGERPASDWGLDAIVL